MAGNRGQFTSVTASRALGFGVGNPEFLDAAQSKVAKYWRSIEFGTHGFVGTRLFMLRGPKINKWGKVTDLRDARRSLEAGTTGGGTIDRHTGKERKPLKIVLVGHEIAAMRAYEKAAAAFDPIEREREAIRQAFEDSGLETASAVSGKSLRGRSNAVGDVGRRFEGRLRGRGFLTAQAISTRSRSAVSIDRQFQANLIAANRLLAEALAGEVALVIKDLLKRPEESYGWLEEATLDARNRFP